MIKVWLWWKVMCLCVADDGTKLEWYPRRCEEIWYDNFEEMNTTACGQKSTENEEGPRAKSNLFGSTFGLWRDLHLLRWVPISMNSTGVHRTSLSLLLHDLLNFFGGKYRIGIALADSLDNLIQSNSITPQLAVRIMERVCSFFYQLRRILTIGCSMTRQCATTFPSWRWRPRWKGVYIPIVIVTMSGHSMQGTSLIFSRLFTGTESLLETAPSKWSKMSKYLYLN